MQIPKFKLQVEGAEGREANLENDDLLPTPLENRRVSIVLPYDMTGRD